MALSPNTKEAVEHVADVFEATGLGAPFKVMLHDSVTVHKDPITGDVVSYKIPDLPQLLVVALITRLLVPRKLCGPEIKFARKVLGLKQQDLASKVEIGPEHLSRCENGVTPLSPGSDKLLRVFAFKEALKLPDMPKSDDKAKLEDALDKIFDQMKLSSVHDVEDCLELHFVREVENFENGGIEDCGSSSWSANTSERAA